MAGIGRLWEFTRVNEYKLKSRRFGWRGGTNPQTWLGEFLVTNTRSLASGDSISVLGERPH